MDMKKQILCEEKQARMANKYEWKTMRNKKNGKFSSNSIYHFIHYSADVALIDRIVRGMNAITVSHINTLSIARFVNGIIAYTSGAHRANKKKVAETLFSLFNSITC